MINKVRAAMAVSLLLLASTSAFAKEGETSVEASLNYGTEAFDKLGGQFGVSAGVGYGLPKNLQGRLDVAYYRSSTNDAGENIAGTRVPIDLGLRYYHALPKVDPELSLYGQGGLELSHDDWKPAAGSSSKSRTSFGALIGAGAEYALDRHFSAVAQLQYHIIEDSYFSTGVGLSYHF